MNTKIPFILNVIQLATPHLYDLLVHKLRTPLSSGSKPLFGYLFSPDKKRILHYANFLQPLSSNPYCSVVSLLFSNELHLTRTTDQFFDRYQAIVVSTQHTGDVHESHLLVDGDLSSSTLQPPFSPSLDSKFDSDGNDAHEIEETLEFLGGVFPVEPKKCATKKKLTFEQNPLLSGLKAERDRRSLQVRNASLAFRTEPARGFTRGSTLAGEDGFIRPFDSRTDTKSEPNCSTGITPSFLLFFVSSMNSSSFIYLPKTVL